MSVFLFLSESMQYIYNLIVHVHMCIHVYCLVFIAVELLFVVIYNVHTCI